MPILSDLRAMRVAVIGGGAAGYFAALSVIEHHPKAQVTIYEKSDKVLSKVRISGGQGYRLLIPKRWLIDRSTEGLIPSWASG